MPDISTCRDSAVRKLKLMELCPYPGSVECRVLGNVNIQKAEDEGANNNQQVEESTTKHYSTCAVVHLVRPAMKMLPQTEEIELLFEMRLCSVL